MRLSVCLAAATVLSLSLVAHADSFETFDLTANFGAGTVDGTLVLDTTTDMFSSIDVSATGFPFDDVTLTSINSQGVIGGEYQVSAGGSNLYLVLPVTNLTGYSGSSICAGDSSPSLCPTAASGNYTQYAGDTFGASSGSLEPAAIPPSSVTPEPSSIALLATGLLGAASLVRRRLA